MYQLFTLFVLTLGFSGFVLAFSFFDEKIHCSEFFNEEGLLSTRFLLILGIIMGILSVLSLFFVLPGDVIIVGDLLPVIAGALATLMLLAWVSVKKAGEKTEELTGFFANIDSIFLSRRNFVGIVILVIAIVHFIFPATVIL